MEKELQEQQQPTRAIANNNQQQEQSQCRAPCLHRDQHLNADIKILFTNKCTLLLNTYNVKTYS